MRQVVADLFEGEGVVIDDNESGGLLIAHLGPDADYACVRDPRDHEQSVLDFLDRNILRFASDPVSVAADEVEKAVLVEVANVAGMHPKIAPRLQGALRIAEIAERDGAGRARTDEDLALRAC